MFRRRQIPKRLEEGENPFLLTFSDFMASLLAIFILVLIVTLIELEKKKNALENTNNDLKKQKNEMIVVKDELIKTLEDIQRVQERIASSLHSVSLRERSLAGMLGGIKDELRERGIAVVLAENDTVLRIPEQQLQFALGKYEISPTHSGSANVIGRALLEALSKPENQALLDTVFLEGHTDSVPNSREMGNWGLSTYRAISLWNFWTEKPGELSGLKSLRTAPSDPAVLPKPLVSVSGYADTRSTHGLMDGLVLKNERSEDRRIDIRFTLVSSEKHNLEGLRGDIKQMREKTNDLIGKLLKNLKHSGDVP
jgi:flagellar motor protein MotB